MLGIGHRKGVRVFAKLCSENATGEQKVVLAALCALGTEGAVPDASIRVLEKFICLLYRVKDDTLDHARPIMLRKKNGRPSTFMSTSDSFHSRCLRAFYQVCVCVCVCQYCNSCLQTPVRMVCSRSEHQTILSAGVAI